MYAHTANAMNATVAHTLIKNLTTTSIYRDRPTAWCQTLRE